MRVLHINSAIKKNSGVMSVLMNYYTHLDRNRIQFDFLYFLANPDDEVREREIKNLGGRVYYLDGFKKINSFNKRLKNVIEENHYSIVHIHDPFVVRFICKTLRECGVKNIIVHSHATRWSDKRLNGIRNQILCMNLTKKVDYCFACSRAAGEFLFGKREFYLMNNAIDLERYAFDAGKRKFMQKELGIEGKTVFGHVGNMCAQKNHRFLIDIFREILSACEDAVLLLIGDGPLRADVESLTDSYGLNGRVKILGKKTNVEDYYQAMDCFILPSLYEGLPMVGVEAQCSGLPVLFSDTITREVGTELSEYLSLNDSCELWADKAISLSRRGIDRSSGERIMRKKGFDISEEAVKLEKEYCRIKGDGN